MYNHPALRGMETFRKGIKTVVSGTMLVGLNVAGVTRLETPTGRGLQAGRSPRGMGLSGHAFSTWASPSGMGTHSIPQEWRRSRREYTFPVGNTPFPQGIHGGASATPASLKRIHPSLKEYPLAGRDCAFPEENETLPVNPLNLAERARSGLTRRTYAGTRWPERWQPPTIAINGGTRSTKRQPSMCCGSQPTMSGTK